MPWNLRHRLWGGGVLDLMALLIAAYLAWPRHQPSAPMLSLRLPPARPADKPAEIQGPRGAPLVVIDPGHGGTDPGAETRLPDGAPLREKDLTLAVARRMKAALLAGGRVRVALTRDGDRAISLLERREHARRLGAALLVSIHADSAPNPQARGATAYTLSDIASDQTAADLAARENRADLLLNADLAEVEEPVSAILIDLAQRETLETATRFARRLHHYGRPVIPFRARYHQMAGFAVLKAPDLPAILFEIGYLTNAEDAARLNSPAGQEALALLMRRAVEAQFAQDQEPVIR